MLLSLTVNPCCRHAVLWRVKFTVIEEERFTCLVVNFACNPIPSTSTTTIIIIIMNDDIGIHFCQYSSKRSPQ
jgi:hypothetical protein